MTSLGDTSLIVPDARTRPFTVEPATPPPQGRADTGPRFGSYRLLRLVGRGGMAAIWEAEQQQAAGTRERVALKLILPHLRDDPEVVRMFRDEARLAVRLAHPNVVRAGSSGFIDGQPFIAFELIDGLDLRACVDARVPCAFAAWVTRQLCAAVGYAHQLCDDDGRWLRLVHRDVTPSNVMLGFDGSIKLLDFGIAKALGDPAADATRHGIVKGKLGYMAPELIAGRAFDQRADLFSLGVILYELLTHQPLFSSWSEVELQQRAPRRRIVPPSAIVAGVPPALERAAMRALAWSADQRYATAEEMAADLDAGLRALPWSDAQTIALVKALALRGENGEGVRTRVAAPPVTRRAAAVATVRRAVVARAKWGAAALFSLVFAVAVAVTQAPSGDALATGEEERAAPAGAAGEWNLVADAEALLPYDSPPPLLRAEDLVDTPPVAPPSLERPRPPAPSSGWRRPARMRPPRHRAGDVDLARRDLFNPFAPPRGARR